MKTIYCLSWLALVLPDYRGLNLPGEILNFWVHHWILLITPIAILWSDQFKHNKSIHFFLLAFAFAGLFHFNIMNIGALVTGKNVSYMLFPPPSKIIFEPLNNFCQNRRTKANFTEPFCA
jgi:hypothetical protein